MSDEQQRRDAEQRRRFGLPQGVDLHNFDPRKAMDLNSLDKILRAQAIARAEAQAATTVIIATIVSLVTSAFSFVAALAWNTAIQAALAQADVKGAVSRAAGKISGGGADKLLDPKVGQGVFSQIGCQNLG